MAHASLSAADLVVLRVALGHVTATHPPLSSHFHFTSDQTQRLATLLDSLLAASPALDTGFTLGTEPPLSSSDAVYDDAAQAFGVTNLGPALSEMHLGQASASLDYLVSVLPSRKAYFSLSLLHLPVSQHPLSLWQPILDTGYSCFNTTIGQLELKRTHHSQPKSCLVERRRAWKEEGFVGGRRCGRGWSEVRVETQAYGTYRGGR